MNLNDLAAKLWPFLARFFMASGTFTPTLFGSGTAGTFTYLVQAGLYTRIGDRCLYSGRVAASATSVAPTGNISIGGLPLTSAASGGNIVGGGVVAAGVAVNLVAGYTQLIGMVNASVSSIILCETGDNVNLAVVQGGEISATFDFYFAGQYAIA